MSHAQRTSKAKTQNTDNEQNKYTTEMISTVCVKMRCQCQSILERPEVRTLENAIIEKPGEVGKTTKGVR